MVRLWKKSFHVKGLWIVARRKIHLVNVIDDQQPFFICRQAKPSQNLGYDCVKLTSGSFQIPSRLADPNYGYNAGNALSYGVVRRSIKPKNSTECLLMLPSKLERKLGLADTSKTVQNKDFATHTMIWRWY